MPRQNAISGIESLREFAAKIRAYAREQGWLCHSALSSARGFPPLVFAKDTRLIFVEVDVGNFNPTAKQEEWRDALLKSGQTWYVWSYGDWTDIERALGGEIPEAQEVIE